MAKVTKAEREERKRKRRADKDARKSRKQAEKERRQDRNDARRANRKQQKFDHSLRKAKNDRIQIRNDRWEANVAARQHAKEVKFEQKGASDTAAYENGIDPNKWKGDAIEAGIGGAVSLGNTAMEVFGGRGGRRDQNGDALTNEEIAMQTGIPSNGKKPPVGIIVAIIGGLIVIVVVVYKFLFKKGKR